MSPDSIDDSAAPALDPAAVRAHVQAVICARVSRDDARRAEALRDYLALSSAVSDPGAADTLAAMVPPLMPSLYRRWAGMFADRLCETAAPEQLAVLCDGGEENGAALCLAFVMFLESERMDRQIAEDLRAVGGSMAGNAEQERLADLAASYLRARVARLAEKDAAKDKGEKGDA